MTCAHCGEPIQRNGDKPSVHATRKFCSRACHAGSKESKGWAAWRPAPTPFPHAHVRRLADAPATCNRCGGLWRKVETGLSCLLCGRECVVAETLMATVRRGVLLGKG